MKILIISSDPVGKQMAGLGIRNYQIASELAEKIKNSGVTLAVPNEPNLREEKFQIKQYKNNFSKFSLISNHDLIISQGFGLAGIAFYFSKKKFLLDLYDPINLEWLESAKDQTTKIYDSRNKFNRDYLNIQLKLANFIVCANQVQLGLWLGMLFSLGRIKSNFYKEDSMLKQVIDVVPFSLRSAERKKSKSVLRGVVKEIGKNDKILIWNGGIWNWFDAVSLIKAMGEIARTNKAVKLYFLGTKHPNPDVKEFRSLNAAYNLAKKLNLLDKTVFFNFGWVDYEETTNYLLEADVAVATYFDNLETRFSNRSRFLDAFWARLPLICTTGDYLSDLVEEKGWGVTIPEGDVDSLVLAIEKLANDKNFFETCKKNLEATQELFSPEKTLKPIVDFCLNPTIYPLKRDIFYIPSLFSIYIRRIKLRLFGSY